MDAGQRGRDLAVERLVAPAKLTVSLEVQGVRDDGLHDLVAEMVSVDLADELTVDPEGDSLVVVTRPPALSGPAAGPENLVRRALAAVGRRAGVRLVKRIPLGGGLGGGSTDAAAILRWAGIADPEVAAALGADVPFCVTGGRAEVTGAGERVRALEHRERSFVLLCPPFGVDTGAVYGAFDALGPGGWTGRPEVAGRNDLTHAALAVEPRLARWRDRLAGATGREPVLAGSGSTWFVEGVPEALGLGGRRSLTVGPETAPLLAVRTVPAGWAGPAGPAGSTGPAGRAGPTGRPGP
ncbi:MAG: 4-(cytidine 5'-diphospho)-2-C-methyl-D-erythritol kinase [Acidimicrobiales bacterium]